MLRPAAYVALLLPLYSSAFSQGKDSVVLRFAGDCMLAGHYESYARTDPSLAFRDFNLFRTADVGMVNLECPVTVRGEKVEKPYNFRMHPRFVEALKRAGISLVNLANNHIFDYGPEGLFDTISYLDSAGIRHVGGGRNRKEAHAPVIVSLKGKRIGFLGYYGGGEAPAATRTDPGVARREIPAISADIKKLRDRDSVDYVVITLHWGTEKEVEPDSSLVWFAHRIVDAGADLIIGHHPHVLQGIERYKSGVIVYSLGNFLFGGSYRPTYETALFEVVLTRGEPRFRLVPLEVSNWRVTQLEGSRADELIEHVRQLSLRFPNSIFIN
jgi:poly-gamma-glutamate capsule biosynthesis protein CapA/YwtB (metallophosphatase superfamily)